MKIGKYTIYLLDAGRFRLDGGAMFGVVPRALWERHCRPDEQNRIQMATNLLLIRGKGRNILVDTGLGEKFDQKFSRLYAVDSGRYSLAGALGHLGILPSQITDVVLTHLHFDHAGGATARDGDGKVHPAFPEARYYVQERQWAWARRPTPKDQASFVGEDFLPLQEAGQLTLLSGSQELFPGIEVVTVDGHTTGQQLVIIRGDKRTLLYAGDLIPTAAHIPVPWVMAYDVQPLKTIAEKQRYLARAVAEKWWVVFPHDSQIPCGTIAQTNRRYGLKESIELAG